MSERETLRRMVDDYLMRTGHTDIAAVCINVLTELHAFESRALLAEKERNIWKNRALAAESKHLHAEVQIARSNRTLFLLRRRLVQLIGNCSGKG